MKAQEESSSDSTHPTSDFFEIINNRRSIRNFTDKPIPEEIIKKVLTAGVRATYSAQLCSIVYTSDPEKIRTLRKTGVYPTTKTLLIFLIDIRKLERLLSFYGRKHSLDHQVSVWLGLQDVILVVENILLAAESLGLSSVLLERIPIHSKLVSEVFEIPSRVIPAIGMSLGYEDPSIKTEIRPRYPFETVVFEDSYRDISEYEMNSCMEIMDSGTFKGEFYIKERVKALLKQKKEESDFSPFSWLDHVERKFFSSHWTKISIGKILKFLGFKFKKENDKEQ